ncbi:MAG: thioredoxin family protein [Planctomycetaceae bacterium]
MRRTDLRLAAVGLCLLGLSVGFLEAGENGKSGLQWQPDLHTAHALAVRDNKPLLLVFGAEWCGWCKKLEKNTLGDPQMVEYINRTFVPIHIDVDQQKKVAEILEVESLPCTIVLSPEADLLGRFEGFDKPEGLYKKLAAAKQLQERVAPAAGSTAP